MELKEAYTIYEYQKKKLYFLDYSEAGIPAAYHTDTDTDGTKWKLSAVFKPEIHEMCIQMSNFKTTESDRFLRRLDQLLYDKIKTRRNID